MNFSQVTTSALAVLLSMPVVSAQTGDGDALVANPEEDTFAIAYQLYRQANTMRGDDAGKKAVYSRAAHLFGEFARKFPNSSKLSQANFMKALCQEKAGKIKDSNKTKAQMADAWKAGVDEFVAAAAYHVAGVETSAGRTENAVKYYRVASHSTAKISLKSDALYRLGRNQIKAGKRADAIDSFNEALRVPQVPATVKQACYVALAQLAAEDGRNEDAYGFLQEVLKITPIEPSVEGISTLQLARIAARLGKKKESADYYARLNRISGMEKYNAESHLASLRMLYEAEKYVDVIKYATVNKPEDLEDGEKKARYCFMLGTAYMKTPEAERARERARKYFQEVERLMPETELAAQAGYYTLAAARSSARTSDFATLAQTYLQLYAAPDKKTAGAKVNDWARFLYAEYLVMNDPRNAYNHFRQINIGNLPEKLQPEARFKMGWCAHKLHPSDKETFAILDEFITTYPSDPRVPQVLIQRASGYARSNETRSKAFVDYDTVIQQWPRSEHAAMACQSAARLCHEAKDNKRMMSYYTRFLELNPSNPAAKAEANFRIACVLRETSPAEAITYFERASELNDGYKAPASLYIVQCYFKLEDAENLRQCLSLMEPAQYNVVPSGILRWCGWRCFKSEMYSQAEKYLTDSLRNEPLEEYQDAQGRTATRPRVEPLIWKTLARVRYEIGAEHYADGLVAVEHYLSKETHPHRLAEAMRDKALLLMGLNMPLEARKVCEEAIALGVNGPVQSALYMTLGDTYYVEGDYSEAAKKYGRTANFVADKDIKPQSLYRIISALNRSNRSAEAAQYEKMLKDEFPNWSPSERDSKMFGPSK